MTTLLQVLFGIVVLSLPMIIAGTMILALASSAALVPVLMPLTTLLVLGAIGVAWLRWLRAKRACRPV